MATPTIHTSVASTTTSTATPSCTTAVPGKYGRVPATACNSYYNYDPSFEAAIAFSVLFAIITVIQTVEAFSFRKGFCWVIIMGLSWETGSFITQALGSHHQQSSALALVSQLLILLAPLWINAYVYMTTGRMIWAFLPEKKIWKVKAMSIGKYFVWLDIISFLVQGMGGAMLSPGSSPKTAKIGMDIYMAGVGVQQFFICLFITLIIRFHYEMLQLEKTSFAPTNKKWKWLTYALYATLALITTRIIYRLLEFSRGVNPSTNPLPFHEGYMLALDATPMFLAGLILCIIHPGMVLVGPESDFPSRKEKKAIRKANKEAKKAKKAEKKLGQENTAYSPVYDHSSTNLVQDIEMQNRHEGEFYQETTYLRA
ncbi:hypothetical protein AOQ84DRAFT_314190 [Glonium stellatum]|uniref:Uncharacterized protein n=1 Tax=Glonium stellatum TaxID=574774 RepID=A0A8E2JVI5_9PEZI|nr:hypothetical protein AOQ84DRAFT_314190 [Glonium stellatum]